MSDINRVKVLGEVFTPTYIVQRMLHNISDTITANSPIVDPSCGNGQFLIEIAKLRNMLHTIYGVDIMADNCCDTIARLLFWNIYNIDIFTEDSKPCSQLDYNGYDGHHTYDWIKKQSNYERSYIYNDHFVIVRKCCSSLTGAWFEYSIDDRIYYKYPYIVCADSLLFDYREFDNDVILHIPTIITPTYNQIIDPLTISVIQV